MTDGIETVSAEAMNAAKPGHDPVNHPSHYCMGKFEVIDVIEAYGFLYHAGNAVKYIARCKRKDNEVQDLQKARWYLQRLIDVNQNSTPTISEFTDIPRPSPDAVIRDWNLLYPEAVAMQLLLEDSMSAVKRVHIAIDHLDRAISLLKGDDAP